MAEINVTPFTDVLLVLLIIFMVLAALVAPPGFERSLPCKCHATAKPHMVPLDVTISPTGSIAIAGRATDARSVYADLRAALGGSKRPIAMQADAKAPYGAILRFLDAAKAAGDPDVTFVTQ